MSSSLPVLLVIAPDQFNDTEFTETQQALHAKGLDTVVASTKVGIATGMDGLHVEATHTIDTLNAAEFHAISVIGGYGSVEYLWENKALHALVKAFDAEGKVVSAICVSPVVLAKAGVLNDKHATVWTPGMPQNVEALNEAGARYNEAPVVQDGRLLTGNAPDAARAFGTQLADMLG